MTGSAAGCRPARVASHPGGNTPLGISDLTGNVWEWTSSRWLPYPGGKPLQGGDTLFVIRGGAYNLPLLHASASVRAGVPASPVSRAAIAATGFRCAVSLQPSGGS